MKDYRMLNKKAWEEAYTNKSDDYERDFIQRLKTETLPYLDHHLKAYIQTMDLSNQKVVQFCTNNGRELLSIAQQGIAFGVGFDIAKNMVDHANQTAQTLKLPLTFIEQDIMTIDDTYDQQFDVALITIGALCWFDDLKAFFKIVAKTLKPGGLLIMHEAHPVNNMLATPSEANYVKAYPRLLINDYFKTTPWVEASGMGYMTGAVEPTDTTFVSFSHAFDDMFTAIISNNIEITGLKEYDVDISNLFGHLDHTGIPLSFLLTGMKK